MDDVIRAAGARNAYEGADWNVMPLEQLVQRPAAIVARGFFAADQTRDSAWSPSRHSGWRRALAEAQVVDLPTPAISCAAWFQIDAAETLADAIRTRR
jgi:iron complex transport system substrate-binding protein